MCYIYCCLNLPSFKAIEKLFSYEKSDLNHGSKKELLGF